MAAATSIRRRPAQGSNPVPRHGTLKALRGTAWKQGWLLAAHGERIMNYPDGGFNSAASLLLTTDQGGPLSVTGADANGALKMIALQPNVRFQLANGASTSITVTRGAANTDILLTCAVASVTATVASQALLAQAQVAELIDVAPSGTGAGFVAVFAQTAVPHVRIYGVAGGDVDNSGAVTDLVLEYGTASEVAYTGKFLFPGSPPVTSGTFSPPHCGAFIDNQTVAACQLPLQLRAEICGVEDRDYDTVIVEVE